MNAPTLLGPSARPIVAIGGDSSWRSRYFKDVGILCSFQWLDLSADGHESCTPCMVLLRPTSQHKGAFVLPQANAYLMANNASAPLQHLRDQAMNVVLTLEMAGTRQDIHRIMDIILEGLPDLVDMPSEPPESAGAIIKQHFHGIEARAKVNGLTVHAEVL